MHTVTSLTNSAKTNFVEIECAKKVKGHAQVFLAISTHNIYDARVWSYGRNKVLASVDLRNENAQDFINEWLN